MQLGRAVPVGLVEMLMAGMDAARALECYFPEVFAAEVAGHTASLKEFWIDAHLFLHLVHTRLITLSRVSGSSYAAPASQPHWYGAKNLEAILQLRGRAIEDLNRRFMDTVGLWMRSVRPAHFGPGRNVHSVGAHRRRLTYALWAMVRKTKWMVVPMQSLLPIFRQLPNSLGEQLRTFPALNREAPVVEIVCRTAELVPIPELEPALRYAFGQTANRFSDAAEFEVSTVTGSLRFDDPAVIYAISAEQRAGRAYAATYDRLARRVNRKPEVIWTILEGMLAAESELSGRRHRRHVPTLDASDMEALEEEGCDAQDA